MSSSKDGKVRKAISDVQRKDIRDYYHQDPDNKPPYREVQRWFLENTQHKLSESIISRILSPSYAYLDQPGAVSSTKEKNREANWPVLENALYEWQRGMEIRNVTVTGKLLKEKATALWNNLPEYVGQPLPKFSAGWLDGFKKRYQIKLRARQGETVDGDGELLERYSEQHFEQPSQDSSQVPIETVVNQNDTRHQPERGVLENEMDIDGKRAIREALHALSELRIYEQQQENGYSEVVKFLDKYEMVIQKRKATMLKR